MIVWFFQHPSHLPIITSHDVRFQTLKTIFESHKVYHKTEEFMDQCVLKHQYILLK